MKFRKKPVVVEAIQWFKAGDHPAVDFNGVNDMGTEHYSIRTLEGRLNVSQGDWIIKGVEGEFYPCKPNIFEKTYEKVEE